MRLLGLLFTFSAYFLSVMPLYSAPMSFKSVSNGGNSANCCWVIATGEITSETPAVFEQFIDQNNVPELGIGEIRLNASGSDVNASIMLGRLFRKYKAKIIIGKSREQFKPWHERTENGNCSGTCILAFLGGSEREIPTGNTIEIGQFLQAKLLNNDTSNIGQKKLQSISSSVENQITTGRIVQYLYEMGIDPNLYSLSVSIPPSIGSRAMTDTEINSFRVENAKDTISDWFVNVENNGLTATINSALTKRALSLYCKNYSGYFLRISINKAYEKDLRDVLETGGKTMSFTTDDKVYTAQIIDINSSAESNVSVTFQINRNAANAITQTKNLYASIPNVSLGRNWENFVANSFSFFGLPGDQRLPTRALKVCQS